MLDFKTEQQVKADVFRLIGEYGYSKTAHILSCELGQKNIELSRLIGLEWAVAGIYREILEARRCQTNSSNMFKRWADLYNQIERELFQ